MKYVLLTARTIEIRRGEPVSFEYEEMVQSVHDAPVEGVIQDLAARIARQIRLKNTRPKRPLRLPAPDHSRQGDAS